MGCRPYPSVGGVNRRGPSPIRPSARLVHNAAMRLLRPSMVTADVAGLPRRLDHDSIQLDRIMVELLCLSMIFSDLPSPAEASSQMMNRARGFAQAGNRFPLFGIMH